MAVYFIRNQASGNVKIGYSASPQQRLRQLQTATPDSLAIEKEIEGGTMELEKDLHRVFEKHRLGGEWFEGDPVMQAMGAVEDFNRARSGRRPAVYCAGKIGPEYPWRAEIFGQDGIESGSYDPIRNRDGGGRDGFRFAGPFFIDCHSKPGDGDHGIAACCGGHTREDVVRLCVEWLMKSDVVFCWLCPSAHHDKGLDAFGTVFELGYAAAVRKPVFLAYEDGDRYQDQGHLGDAWFALAAIRDRGGVVYPAKDIEDAWYAFRVWFWGNVVVQGSAPISGCIEGQSQ